MISYLKQRLFPVVILLAALLILGMVGLSTLVSNVSAQTVDELWSEPVNISNSGAASQPKIIVDAIDRVHLVWEDEFEGINYAIRVDGSWTRPETITFPFEPPLANLEFVVDQGNLIHALWREEESAELFYSFVQADNFSISASWSPAVRLDEDIAALASRIDPAGRLHLVYAKVADSPTQPSGIYYRSANAPNFNWASPQQLYESPYIRGLAQTDANIDIWVVSADSIHVVWDVPPLERVFYTRSEDGGNNWQQANHFDSREETDSFDARGPGNAMITSSSEALFRFWQAGHNSQNCAQYYQISSDNGENWSENKILGENLIGCPNNNQFLQSTSGDLILLQDLAIGVFLVAWDGEKFSDPQLQTALTNFINPNTFRQVDFECRQAALELTQYTDDRRM